MRGNGLGNFGIDRGEPKPNGTEPSRARSIKPETEAKHSNGDFNPTRVIGHGVREFRPVVRLHEDARICHGDPDREALRFPCLESINPRVIASPIGAVCEPTEKKKERKTRFRITHIASKLSFRIAFFIIYFIFNRRRERRKRKEKST